MNTQIIFIFIAMLFAHVFDDYGLQGCLANLKQKGWWEKNCPDKLYKKDYIMGLLMHSISWSFMIMLPLAIYSGFNLDWMLIAYPINTAIHMHVDDLKANRHRINLIGDQLIHIGQIILTFVAYILVKGI